MAEYTRTVLVLGARVDFHFWVLEKLTARVKDLSTMKYWRAEGRAVADGVRYQHVQDVPHVQGWPLDTTFLIVGPMTRELQDLLPAVVHRYRREDA